jgi:hypothetical protein
VHEQPEGYGHEPYPNQPPGGGYPPQQPPYPGQQPPYGPPQGPSWGQPGAGGQPPMPGGYGPQDPGLGGWGPPPGPPKKSSGPVVAVAVVAALVLLGGGGAIVWALSSGGDKTHETPPVAVSTAPTIQPSFPTTGPTSFPSPSEPAFPTPTSSPTLDDSLFVQAGDCVRITGRSPHLKMLRADCGSAPYKVLKRFSGTSDRTKCRSVPGYTTAFWATSKKYTFLSYVICLKHQ